MVQNPMGGCLPLVLQIPVFFAIYRVLLNAIELKGAAWIFWVHDLAEMDPYFVLPILMGLTMFIQQKKLHLILCKMKCKRKYSNFTCYFHILLLMVPNRFNIVLVYK